MLTSVAAAIRSVFTRVEERPAQFATPEEFVAFLGREGGSINEDSLIDAEVRVASEAARAGLVLQHPGGWGAGDTFRLTATSPI